MIEFTLFTLELILQNDYDVILVNYISDILQITDYTVNRAEFGVIIMTTYPFAKSSSTKVTKIGTAGGWVKASSGYSFKNAEKYAAQIVKI